MTKIGLPNLTYMKCGLSSPILLDLQLNEILKNDESIDIYRQRTV